MVRLHTSYMVKILQVEIEEPESFNNEREFEEFMTKVIDDVLSDLKKQGVVSNYYIFRELGFDIAVFLDKGGSPKVKFFELKLYKGQRAGGVGFGNQRGEGPQVEVLLNDKETLAFFNKFLRWIVCDALAMGERRYVFIDNIIAKECAMGEVRRGKQNNFNINKLRKHAITWGELIQKIREFLTQ